jgi:hypothetical protein
MKVMILGWVRNNLTPEVHYMRYDGHRCVGDVQTSPWANFLKSGVAAVIENDKPLLCEGSSTRDAFKQYWSCAVEKITKQKSPNKRSAKVNPASPPPSKLRQRSPKRAASNLEPRSKVLVGFLFYFSAFLFP